MSERPREDDRTTRSTSDPYGYLTAGGADGESYLPGDLRAAGAGERAAADDSRAGAGTNEADETGAVGDPQEPAAAVQAPDEGDVTVGMTRRELRERRARRAERAAAAASVPAVPSEPQSAEPGASDDLDATGSDGSLLGAAPSTEALPVTAPSWGAPGALASHEEGVAPAANDADALDSDAFDTSAADGSVALAPGWHDPEARTRERGRRRLLLIVVGVLVVVAIAVAALLIAGRGDDAPTDPATSATGSTATGLAARIPTTVNGGEFSADGRTGVTYQLDDQGLVENPLPPTGAAESLTALYTGGTADVTLTASTFATADEALAAATAIAGGLGTPVDTGVVFPDTGLGTYWTFNNDGLVTVVWHAGEDGAYVVVSEDAEDALGFYNGLDF